ncbi:MAG: hypothetical protein WBR56_13610 [Sedimenticolaceae bacterium]
MSKRARITLQPIDEPDATRPTEEPAPVQAAQSRAETEVSDNPEPQAATPETAKWRPATGLIVKAVLAGLAIAAVVLLIRKRPL